MQDRESYIRNLWRPRQLELTSSRQLFPKKMWSLTGLLVILCEKAICHFLNQLHVASFPAAIWTFWVLNFLSDLSFNVFAWGPQTLPPPAPSLLAPQGPWGDPRGLKRNVLKQQCSVAFQKYLMILHTSWGLVDWSIGTKPQPTGSTSTAPYLFGLTTQNSSMKIWDDPCRDLLLRRT